MNKPTAIIQTHHTKEKSFMVISNSFLNDSILSLKAKGLLVFLRSKPGNWTATLSNLIDDLNEHDLIISAAMQELRDRGYLPL